MKRASTFFALLAASMIIASCAPKLIPFTQSIREEYKLSEAELKTLQFYVSDEINLHRGEPADIQQESIDGVLTIETGRESEQVTFNAKVKGIVKSVPGDNQLRVVFEADDQEGLMFGIADRTVNDRYRLMVGGIDSKLKITYKGENYYTSKRSGDSYLMIRMKKVRKIQNSRRDVKGMKI